MSESVNFIQGRKEQYNPSEMQGGLFFSKDSKEILFNGESYGNATPADEEDITAGSGNLKLKDRAYDEANFFFGKGYKILRKNIQDGKNILTQDMINEPNTVYEIRYDFDGNGQRLQLHPSSYLVYAGGSISNANIRTNTVEAIVEGVEVYDIAGDNGITCSKSDNVLNGVSQYNTPGGVIVRNCFVRKCEDLGISIQNKVGIIDGLDAVVLDGHLSNNNYIIWHKLTNNLFK